MTNGQKQYLTVTQFCEKNQGSWPSLGALRSIIHQAKKGNNDFQDAFKFVGKRILISEKIFWDIIEKKKCPKINKKDK